jgi:hypothetical protein
VPILFPLQARRLTPATWRLASEPVPNLFALRVRCLQRSVEVGPRAVDPPADGAKGGEKNPNSRHFRSPKDRWQALIQIKSIAQFDTRNVDEELVGRRLLPYTNLTS